MTLCYWCGKEVKAPVRDFEFNPDGVYCSNDCLRDDQYEVEGWLEEYDRDSDEDY